MSTPQFKNTSVDLSGLLKVLSENLYSQSEVAIRELVQNASDAIGRRRLQSSDEFSPRIDVSIDSSEKTLTIVDNGSGLTADEIEQFLARIGSGFTRTIKTPENDFIGAFGLGFLTAYMIGKRVVMETTSVNNPAVGSCFVSDNGERYIVSQTEPGPIGSRVTVHMKNSHENLSDFDEMEGVLSRYCRLMIAPIHLQENDEPINIAPPWRVERDDEPLIRRQDRRKEFAELMESRFEPLCTIPISSDDDNRGAGLMWIHNSSTFGGADNRWMQIYVRGMMVCQNKHEFLPSWAGFVSGVYESRVLSPTASREDLQTDDEYFDAQEHVADNLIKGLAEIARTQPETWRTILRRHNDALLGAAIADPALYEVLKDDLQLPTTEGDLTLEDIHARSPNGFTVTTHTDGGADEVVARAFGTPVILGYRYGAAAMLQRYAEETGTDIIELGTSEGHTRLFPSQTVSGETQALLSDIFGETGATLRYAKFEPDYLSVIALVDKEQQLKAFYESDDADRDMNAGVLRLARAFTKKIDPESPVQLVLNLGSPLMQLLIARGDNKAKSAAQIMLASARMLGTRKALGADGFIGAMQTFNAHLMTLLGDADE